MKAEDADEALESGRGPKLVYRNGDERAGTPARVPIPQVDFKSGLSS